MKTIQSYSYSIYPVVPSGPLVPKDSNQTFFPASTYQVQWCWEEPFFEVLEREEKVEDFLKSEFQPWVDSFHQSFIIQNKPENLSWISYLKKEKRRWIITEFDLTLDKMAAMFYDFGVRRASYIQDFEKKEWKGVLHSVTVQKEGEAVEFTSQDYKNVSSLEVFNKFGIEFIQFSPDISAHWPAVYLQL